MTLQNQRSLHRLEIVDLGLAQHFADKLPISTPITAEELLTGNYYAFYRGSNFEESISIEYSNREYTSIQIADFPYGLKENDTTPISEYTILGCIDLDDENALFHYVLCCTEDTEQEYLLLIPDPKLGNKKTLFEAKQPLAFCVKADFS